MSVTVTHQFAPKTCPNCQQTNAALALFCVQCGAPLPAPDNNPLALAELLAARLNSIAQQVTTNHAEALQKGALVLYVPANDAAVVMQKTEKLVMGRAGVTTDQPVYDLTPFNAYTLGVSRRHALFSHSEQGFFVMDIGSANGTWANSKRLTPHTPHLLKSNDQIWLGQLILLVYLQAPAASQPPPAS